MTLADRLAWSLLIALPLAMAIANRSAPMIVSLAALAAVVAALMRRAPLMAACRETTGALRAVSLALIVWAAVSVLWSARPGFSLFALAEGVLPVIAAFVLAVCLGRMPPRAVMAFVVSFAVACLFILLDFQLDFAIRKAMHARAVAFAYNRSVITLLVLYWPLALLLWAQGRRRLVAALGALLAITIVRAISGASVLGMIVAVPVLALAWWKPGAARWLVLAGLLGALAIAPFKGPLFAAYMPARYVAALKNVHAGDRINIWQSFDDVVRVRPLNGTGIGTSEGLGHDPVAQMVPADRREMLNVGHPHDAFLQIWVELGLIGALLVAAIFTLTIRALAHAPKQLQAPSLAMIAAAAAVANVGHGAWQGWWIAALGAAIVWFRVRPREKEPMP